MPNKSWSSAMTDVDAAAGYAREMVNARAGALGARSAMESTARAAGVGYWTVWGLLNKPPKRVASDVLRGLRRAYLAHQLEQCRRAHHLIRLNALREPDDADLQGLVAEAARLVAQAQAQTHADGARAACGRGKASKTESDAE